MKLVKGILLTVLLIVALGFYAVLLNNHVKDMRLDRIMLQEDIVVLEEQIRVSAHTQTNQVLEINRLQDVIERKDKEFSDLESDFQCCVREIGKLQEEVEKAFKVNTVLSNASDRWQAESERLQGELRKANEGKDVWPCGTLKDPNGSSELDLVKAELEVVQNAWTETIVAQEEISFENTVEDVIDSIIHIKTEGMYRGQEVTYQSTGFFISPDTLITARHVTVDTENFHIFTIGGHELKATKAIAHHNADIALIKVEDLTCVADDCEVTNGRAIKVKRGKHTLRFSPLEFGNTDDLRLGQDVFMIGASLGQLHFPNVTKGIVSALNLNRAKYDPVPLPYGWESTEDMGWSVMWMTDAASYGGNSGSPVLTMEGKVVGVLVGGFDDYESISYTMPTNLILDDLDEIKTMFTMMKYRVEKKKKPDPIMESMMSQIESINRDIYNLYQEISQLVDGDEIAELEEAIEELKEDVALIEQDLEVSIPN